MLVSHRKKFIFVKTGKTAGTSVEVFFEKFCFPENEWIFSHGRDEYINPLSGIVGYRGASKDNVKFYNHMPASKLCTELGKDIWDNYFKFTVVRNPFDKMVSAFFHFEKSQNPNKYSMDNLTDIQRFRNWVNDGGKILDRDIYLIAGEVAVDYFIRFESLKEDIETVCQKLQLDYDLADLPTLKSEHRDRTIRLKDFYDAPTEKIVRDLFKFEIEYFDYDLV
ncbi:MAG: hypothetical protein ACI83B_004079 [Sediminicola sp.]|jgi:hypothetical protein